mgnify:FL=1
MHKQVIVVRKDLNMSSGKIAAQVAHAVLNSFIDADSIVAKEQSISLTKSDIEWLSSGATKIVVACMSEDELFAIFRAANAAGLHTALVLDQGRTELKRVTYTCCAIGPAPSAEVNKITEHLRLL